MTCFECGEDSQNNHHVVPRSLGGSKTVPLCLDCHGKVHDRSMSASELTRQGLARARARGVKLGRPPKVQDLSQDILRLRREGLTLSRIGEELGLDRSTVGRFLRRNPIEEGAGG